MHKNLLAIIIFLFVLSTVLVLVFRPKTHKPIVFENKDFEISLMTEKAEVDMPKINVEAELPKIEIEPPSINVNVNLPQVNVTQPKIQTPQVKKPLTATNNQTKNTVTKPQEKPQKIKEEKQLPETKNNKEQNLQMPKKDTEKTVSQPKELPKEKVEPSTPPAPKVLTKEEEIIAWNKWRSDLQNKLMRDSKISAPLGTSFHFSFTVDKLGNITNLKTWSSNPSYTPLAVRVIKPLLLSYQHTAILKFPEGSQRIITNAEGGFTMAHSSRYSSPSDYNDYERVTK